MRTAASRERRFGEMRGRVEARHAAPGQELRRQVERLRKRLESATNRLAYMRRRLKRAEGMLGFEISAAPHADRLPKGLIGHVLDALGNVPVGHAIQCRPESTKDIHVHLHGQAKLRGWKVAVRTVGETVLVLRLQ